MGMQEVKNRARLRELEECDAFYHWTLTECLEKALEEGLKLNGKNGVFLFNNFDIRNAIKRDITFWHGKEDFTLLKVDKTYIMENKMSLLWDEVGEPYSVYCFELKQCVPNSKINLHH